MYVERQGSTSNTDTFWFFMDLDGDGLMEAGELGWRVVHSGSNRSTKCDVYLYTPANPAGDPMVDAQGFADGYTLPGSLGPGAIYSEDEPDGGTPGGSVFEERLPWSVIGVAPGTPIGFHVSSSNSSNPTGVAQQVDDNLGSLGGGAGSLHYDHVTISPDRSGSVSPGGSILYAHVIENLGTRDASYALRTVSSIGTSVTLYSDTNGDGIPDELIARDVDGDGDFTDAGDLISPGWDRDGDGLPETPVLAAGAIFRLLVEVQADAALDGRHDELVIEAFLPSDESGTHDEVTDTTHVGLVIVRFDREGTTQAGVPVRYAVEVCNGTTAQVLDISVTSSTGSSIALYSDATCSGQAGTLLARDTDGDGTWDAVFAGDSDADGLPDTGPLATGACACFVVEVTPPSTSALGTLDETIVTARAMPSGTTSGAAVLTTRVAALIELTPNHLFAEGTGKYSGAGKSVFFPHIARNNGPQADLIDFAVVPPVNDAGWVVVIWSDPNGDGNISDGRIITRTGLLARNGGTESFVVEVRIPDLTATGVSSRTVVTGTSFRNPSARATVTDEVIVSVLATYSDPLFTLAATAFVPCDTIYVLATGLRRRDSYELLYADGLGRIVSLVSPWVADDAGVAEDAYFIKRGDAAGTWVIEVREDELVLGTRTVLLETEARLQAIGTDRASYPRIGANLVVDVTVVNENLIAPFLNATLEYVLLDPSGTRYYHASSRTFVPYTEGDVSRTQALPRMDPGASFVDRWTEPSVSYPADGVYCVVVRVVVPCGAILDQSATCYTVGAGVEQCANGIDDDGDTLIDCDDPECGLAPNCREFNCSDGLDDDGDGLIDCEDPDCAFSPDCQENCTNGIDDDGDGRVDCLDSDCDGHPACVETNCSNGIDDDGDGLTDCADPDCAMDPTCLPETNCSDGIDNDEDTLVDCADPDCVMDPACADPDWDGDGVPNGEDCAPLDPGAWAIPLEVPQLDVDRWGDTAALLTWTDMSAQAGPVIAYDVLTGFVSELHQDRNFVRSECLAMRTTATGVLDGRRIYAEQDAFYYLVRAANACGVGTWGTDSFGVERIATRCTP